MAYITRFYDDNDVIAKLREVRPDISFGEKARIVNIGVEPPIENTARVVMDFGHWRGRTSRGHRSRWPESRRNPRQEQSFDVLALA